MIIWGTVLENIKDNTFFKKAYRFPQEVHSLMGNTDM